MDDEFEEQRIEFDSLRVVDDLGCRFVPVLRLEIDVGCKVDVTLIELGFHLHKGGALVVELVLAVVHQPIPDFLHGYCFLQRYKMVRDRAGDGHRGRTYRDSYI